MSGSSPRVSGLDFSKLYGDSRVNTPKVAMTGLDPIIHAAPLVRSSEFRASGTPWIPGSSPGMTILG